MGSPEYRAHLSGLPIPALGSKECGSIPGPGFSPLCLQSPASHHNSPFTSAQPSHPDLRSMDEYQASSKPGATWISRGSFWSDGQFQQPTRQSSILPPAYDDQLDSENFNESTVGPNWQPPPYILDDYQTPGLHIDQNAYETSEQHNGISAHPDLSTSDLETAPSHCPRKKIKITEPQFETDEKCTPERKCVAGNKHCQPGHCSANPPWSPLLEKALIELFPDSHTFRDCMESLILAYQKSTTRPSRDHGVDIPGTDKSSSADWVQAEYDNARTKPFPVTIPSESSDTNSESYSDREIESAGHEENENDSVNSSEPRSTTGIDHILNVTNDSAGAISSEQNAQDLPLSQNPLSPNAKDQSSTDKRTIRRFGCPFYQRNPEKHQFHRSCEGPGWEAVHRVK
jgi:hypothetical protein